MRHLKLLLLAFLFLQPSCMDQDPFGRSTRDITGAYELMQFEDGKTYYLIGPSDISNEGHGAIEGTVGKIGWNENFILVWQNESGSGQGWRLVDVKTGCVSNLIPADEIDNDLRADRINTFPAADAWSGL